MKFEEGALLQVRFDSGVETSAFLSCVRSRSVRLVKVGLATFQRRLDPFTSQDPFELLLLMLLLLQMPPLLLLPLETYQVCCFMANAIQRLHSSHQTDPIYPTYTLRNSDIKEWAPSRTGPNIRYTKSYHHSIN